MSERHRLVNVGQTLPHRSLATIHGETVTLPHPERLVHLQFRRFAGCPICNTHLRSVVARHQEIEAAGVLEVVVFHSTVEAMLPYQGELPFAAIADPDKRLYAEFGVRESVTAVTSARAVGASMRGIAASIRTGGLRGATGAGENHLGLPADFLIDTHGAILAIKYGTHAYDQWTVDEILDLARATTGSSTD